jgi:hypothetical protein
MIATKPSTNASNGAWAIPTLPPGVRSDSLYADSRVEADRFKWYRSEEAGRDLGEEAIKHWVKDHWHGYLRTKWLEHLQGKTFWIELKRCEFGHLKHFCDNDDILLNRIIDKLKTGQENLDVIRWAVTEHLPLPPIHRILTAVDVNSLHLVHQFDSTQ